MKIICIYNYKGGVAKTTGCISIASTMSMPPLNKKVLLVDADPSCNLTQFFEDSIGAKEISQPNLFDFFSGKADTDELIRTFTYYRYPGDKFKVIQKAEAEPQDLEHNFIYTKVQYEGDDPADAELETVDIEAESMPTTASRYCTVSLIPGAPDLARTNFDNKMNFLRDLLEKYEDNFDYVLIDCPPENMPISDCILRASDCAVVPMGAQSDSINGFEKMIRAIKDVHDQGYKIRFLGTYFAIVGQNESIPRKLMAGMKEAAAGTDYMFDTMIKRDALADKCRYAGIPLPVYRRSAPLAKQYDALTQEILSRLE